MGSKKKNEQQEEQQEQQQERAAPPPPGILGDDDDDEEEEEKQQHDDDDDAERSTTTTTTTWTNHNNKNTTKKKKNHETLFVAAAVDEISNIQDDMISSIHRTQQDISMIQSIGTTTLMELSEQHSQMNEIDHKMNDVHEKLIISNQLQNKFSRWTTSFFPFNNSKAAAKKVAKKELDYQLEKQQNKRKQQQQQQHTAQSKYSNNNNDTTKDNSNSIMFSTSWKGFLFKKKEKKIKKKNMDSSNLDISEIDEKGLLFGIQQQEVSTTTTTSSGENDDDDDDDVGNADWKRIANKDTEVNDCLDILGNQLDELMNLSSSIQNEVQTQQLQFDEIITNHKMDTLHYKSCIVNNRTGRFLTGHVQKQYKKECINHISGFW